MGICSYLPYNYVQLNPGYSPPSPREPCENTDMVRPNGYGVGDTPCSRKIEVDEADGAAKYILTFVPSGSDDWHCHVITLKPVAAL